jgi:predicted  nucleic acid-binding Zn-ribbon protein
MLNLADIKDQLFKRDLMVNEMERERDIITSKLQEANQEYISMNEKLQKLKQEAEHGSDEIISRNEVLQRNMEKLAKDFELASKEVSGANHKVKEMEFELE